MNRKIGGHCQSKGFNQNNGWLMAILVQSMQSIMNHVNMFVAIAFAKQSWTLIISYHGLLCKSPVPSLGPFAVITHWGQSFCRFRRTSAYKSRVMCNSFGRWNPLINICQLSDWPTPVLPAPLAEPVATKAAMLRPFEITEITEITMSHLRTKWPALSTKVWYAIPRRTPSFPQNFCEIAAELRD